MQNGKIIYTRELAENNLRLKFKVVMVCLYKSSEKRSFFTRWLWNWSTFLDAVVQQAARSLQFFFLSLTK